MDFNINWAFLGGILLVGGGPLLVHKSGLKLYFDSKLFGVSKFLNLFVALQNLCLYISLASINKKNASLFTNEEIKYLCFLLVTSFVYFILGILFSKSFSEDIVLKKSDEMASVKYILDLEKELPFDKKQKLEKLNSYFFKLKILLVISVALYLLFFFSITMALIKSGFY